MAPSLSALAAVALLANLVAAGVKDHQVPLSDFAAACPDYTKYATYPQ